MIGLLLIGLAVLMFVLHGKDPGGGHGYLLMAIVAVGVYTAVYYPLYYWLGPQFVRIALLTLFLLAFVLGPIIFHLGVRNHFWGLLEVFQSYSFLFWTAVLLGFTGLLLFLSLLLSSWLYERKDL